MLVGRGVQPPTALATPETIGVNNQMQHILPLHDRHTLLAQVAQRSGHELLPRKVRPHIPTVRVANESPRVRRRELRSHHRFGPLIFTVLLLIMLIRPRTILLELVLYDGRQSVHAYVLQAIPLVGIKPVVM